MIRALALAVSVVFALPASAAETPAPIPLDIDIGVDNKIILSQDTFRLYLKQEVELERCSLRLTVRDDLLKQEAARAERSWWERNGFYIGAGVGAGLMFLVVWEVQGLLNRK